MGAAGTDAPIAGHLCFFGTYPNEYTVTRMLRASAQAAGFTIQEIHQPLWEQTRTKGEAYFGLPSLVCLAGRYAQALWRLARQVRAPMGGVNAYVTGFQGQLDTLFLAAVRRSRVPILFAPLVTLTETLVEDRHLHPATSLVGRALWQIDRASLRAADHVLIDTEAHRRYLVQRFELDPSRISVWPLGADLSVFKPRLPRPPDGRIRVLFFGSFLPLHGVETMLQAMVMLGDRPNIELTMLGEGPERDGPVAAKAPSNIRWLPWVPYAELPEHVAQADICLGCFGGGTKAAMVIPNKVYQAAAVGRAIISADTPAIREVFADGENIALCPPGDAAALAQAIVDLASDAERRTQMAAAAQRLMQAQFTDAARGDRLRLAIDRACQR